MSVTGPAGFVAAGVAAGLKSSGARDLAVVANRGPAEAAAAVFTTNRFKAAPVIWSAGAVADGVARAVVLNSGGANACTGAAGLIDTRTTAERAGSRLGLPAKDVLVCSTGLIGVPLPMAPLLTGVDHAVAALSDQGGADAAEAIMTTDTHPKTTHIHGNGWSVGGMAKGAGMLAPGMATMLSVLTTDAVVDSVALDSALREATARTFDRVDSDGCMSTNDTVILLASGSSGVEPSQEDLAHVVHAACAELARALVADAEGAEHDIAVTVRGAATEDEAVEVARAVTRSNLVKAAVFGRDPNWGRILSAAGTTSATFDPERVDVSVNDVMVCRSGGVGEDRALVDLEPREVRIDLLLHAGPAVATVWTNDLTHAYVHENSAYST